LPVHAPPSRTRGCGADQNAAAAPLTLLLDHLLSCSMCLEQRVTSSRATAFIQAISEWMHACRQASAVWQVGVYTWIMMHLHMDRSPPSGPAHMYKKNSSKCVSSWLCQHKCTCKKLFGIGYPKRERWLWTWKHADDNYSVKFNIVYTMWPTYCSLHSIKEVLGLYKFK
jgi:hypothetical protein